MKFFMLAASLRSIRARHCAAAHVAQETKISQGPPNSPDWHSSSNQALQKPFLGIVFATTVTKDVVKEECPFTHNVARESSAHYPASIAELVTGGFSRRVYA